MPIKCYVKPNRTVKRTWNPTALTRIVREVCRSHGQEETEDAVRRGLCEGKWSSEELLERVLGWADFVKTMLDIIYGMGLIMESWWFKALVLPWLKRVPYVGTLLLALQTAQDLLVELPGTPLDWSQLTTEIEQVLITHSAGGTF
jgi:hypothetical protein